MKKLLTITIAAMLASPVFADVNTPETEVNSNPEVANDKNDDLIMQPTSEFATEETYKDGFLTHELNNYLESVMEKADEKSEKEYGRKVTKWASAPKLAGYFMSGYYYSSKDGGHSGDGFKVKNVRAIVSGSIFNDFNYLMQLQLTNNSFHMKDYWLEWKKYKEFSIKAGQFIRVFGYECPYNPFEFYEHSYAQLSQKLCGQADRVSEDKGGGRDQGIQVQGDLFPVGKDGHRLLHYQVMVSNGQTINSADKNSQKDVSGCIAIQPVSGLRFAVWGWTGNFTGSNGVTVDRNRYLLSAFYDKNDWTVRAEYAHSQGGKLEDVNDDQAQGWYATVGVPMTKWLKTYFKYDAYQDHATKAEQKTIWSVAPHIALHKNLYFLPSFGYVNDKTLAGTSKYCELFFEVGVRF